MKTLILFLVSLTGCATTRAPMPALTFDATPAVPLDQNHFARDTGSMGEAELRAILAAPVFLEEHARVGIVPVTAHYATDEALPVDASPAVLSEALETSGLFELSSEVSAEWPVDRGLPGLRELAARYRVGYLVLFRHRFNDVTHVNPWALGWVTLVGALVFPGQTVDAAGVLEATLFDVKTGTILVTVNERVRGAEQASPPGVDRTIDALHERLVTEAAPRLAAQLVARCRRLVASRSSVTGLVEAPVR